MPQILTNGAAAVRGRVVAGPGTGAGGHEAATRASTAAGSRAGAHELLAHERRVEAEGAPARSCAASRTPGFGDDEAVGRDLVAQPDGELGVVRERPQVAVVDADEPRVGGERGVQLARVVRLDERLEAEVEGRADEPRERARVGAAQRAAAPRRRRRHAAAGSWRASTTNSLASTGSVVAARARARSSMEPPNQCGSTSTEMTDAPPAW